jgi:hypothetical protein
MNTSTAEADSTAATGVTVTEDTLTVDLSDGRSISAPLAWYPRLLHASIEERGRWRLIGQGHGIHWPDVDEDISVENLLAGRASAESHYSFKAWLLQRSGGRDRSGEGMATTDQKRALSDPFSILPRTSEKTVRYGRKSEYVELLDRIKPLIPSRFPYRAHPGSASWLGSERDREEYLGSHRDRTLWKLCYYGSQKPMKFGVRRAFAVHFPELISFSGWEFVLPVPPHYDVDFVGFSVRNDERSVEKIRRLIELLDWT